MQKSNDSLRLILRTPPEETSKASELKVLEEKFAALTEKYRAMRRQCDELKDENDALKLAASNAESSRLDISDAANEKLDTLEGQNKALKSKVEDMQATIDDLRTSVHTAELLEEATNAELQEKRQEMVSLQQEKTALEAKYKDLVNTYETLLSDFTTSQQKQKTQLETSMQQFQTEKSNIEAELEKEKKQRILVESELDTLRKRREPEPTLVATPSTEFDTTMFDDLKSQIGSLQQEYGIVSLELAQKNDLITEAQFGEQIAKDEISLLKLRLDELGNVESQCETLQSQLRFLRFETK